VTDHCSLAAWISPGVRVAVITGAGISTASGIAAYRRSDGSWKHAAPVQMQEFLRDPAMRRRYWARSQIGWPLIASALPNPAHVALARLEGAGYLGGLITQNVDGLHQRAGHRDVIELHGSLASVVCLGCDWTCARAQMQDWLAADNPWLADAQATAAPDGDAAFADGIDLDGFRVRACPACGGVLKPAVVFYGDSVPRTRVDEAYARVESADVLLVAGSSLMVFSSFRFCRHAHARGIPILAVNDGVTRADDLLALKIEADCGAVLGALADAVVSPSTKPRAKPT
jgi:NAD-dependent SIR2 family protein deacetylase